MSDTKISALTDGTTAVATDVLPIARAGANFKLALSALRDLFNGGVGQPFSESFALSDLATAITTGTSKAYWRPPFAASGLGVRASLLVASSSGTPTVDVNKNGSTILSTKLTIDASEVTSVTAATAAVLSATTWSADDLIEFDIDTAGTGAKGLIVTITGKRA